MVLYIGMIMTRVFTISNSFFYMKIIVRNSHKADALYLML